MVRIALFLAIGVAGAAVAGVATFFVEYQSDVKRADASNLNQVAVGRSLYAQHCAACHGVNLEGQPEWRKRKPQLRNFAAAAASSSSLGNYHLVIGDVVAVLSPSCSTVH